ncbi:hypothetical protein P3T37_000840 [Kitasatospora sp. MAA4]|uniref:hypothetical protein n=1 Tax=Kitasatospora sp. MAA4 TaxID=3035093 RepID=UPI002473522F|nr:hypothetical protein [Kitasatospora sp. MAA4]MDH6131471.1 hypothetical protein [Kitasatospora sp. MAA4]
MFTDDAVHGLGFAQSQVDGKHQFVVDAAAVRGNTLCFVNYYSATSDRTAAQDLLKRQVDALGH